MDYSRETLCRVWLQSAGAASWAAVRRLMDQYGSAEGVWDALSPAMAATLGSKGYGQLAALRDAGRDRVLMGLDQAGVTIVTGEMACFPERLRRMSDPPEVLFVRGRLPREDAPAVAIVGARRDTRYGRTQARRIARELAENGVTVVSGLARGIDTAAHEGALEGGGCTVAVLGNGIRTVYPPENEELARRIVDGGGAVISEFAPDAEPMPFHFPIRNRIISGLSDGVLLVEAQLKSGTASTIAHALEQGREVFALPGNVDAPGSELPLQLLREGANLCVDAGDIFQCMGWSARPRQLSMLEETPMLPEGEDGVLRALQLEEKTFEELLAETGMDSGALSARLTMLEMEGRIERRGGRAYARV